MTTAETTATPHYVIDPERSRQLRRAPEVLLLGRRCPSCAARYEGTGELPPAEEQLREIAQCCARQEGFIVPEMPLLEIVFRTLLAAGNRPVSLQQLHDDLTDRWATPANPRNISPATLRRILAADTYYGIREVEGQGGA